MKTSRVLVLSLLAARRSYLVSISGSIGGRTCYLMSREINCVPAEILIDRPSPAERDLPENMLVSWCAPWISVQLFFPFAHDRDLLFRGSELLLESSDGGAR